jgi:hypothetical protein
MKIGEDCITTVKVPALAPPKTADANPWAEFQAPPAMAPYSPLAVLLLPPATVLWIDVNTDCMPPIIWFALSVDPSKVKLLSPAAKFEEFLYTT